MAISSRIIKRQRLKLNLFRSSRWDDFPLAAYVVGRKVWAEVTQLSTRFLRQQLTWRSNWWVTDWVFRPRTSEIEFRPWHAAITSHFPEVDSTDGRKSKCLWPIIPMVPSTSAVTRPSEVKPPQLHQGYMHVFERTPISGNQNEVQKGLVAVLSSRAKSNCRSGGYRTRLHSMVNPSIQFCISLQLTSIDSMLHAISFTLTLGVPYNQSLRVLCSTTAF